MSGAIAKLSVKVAVGALSSPLEVGAERAAPGAEKLAQVLAAAGCEVVALGAITTPAEATAAGRRCAGEHVDAVALAVACWCEDYLAVDLLEECARPALLWALPGMETGALCGVQQLTCYLKQLGWPYGAVFGTLDDKAALGEAMAFLRGAGLRGRLRRARIGLAGHRVAGMTHTAPNEFVLKKALGPRVTPLDLPGLLAAVSATDEAEAQARWAALKARAGGCEASDADGVDALRVYAAIKAAVAQHGLDALTVGCYPHLMGRVCLAASLLADEGAPCACEGDVHGAVGQLMLQWLTGGPTHNTDWLDPLEDETVVFTHCGAGSLSLAERAEGVTLGPVRLMEQGVCARFTARPGPVTMLAITAAGERYQVALLEGTAVSTEMVFPGNPLRVRFDPPLRDVMAWIHEEGVGHHWMVGYGHVAGEVRQWARIVGDAVRLLTM